MPDSCRSHEYPTSPWGESTPRPFDAFDVDEPDSCASNVLESTFEKPDLETDVATPFVMVCPRGWLQQPCAASTPRDNGVAEKWPEGSTPSTMAPPDSSSPLVCLGTASSPLSTGPGSFMPRRDSSTGQLLLCHPRGPSEQSEVKARRDSNVFTLPATSNGCPHHQSPTFMSQTQEGLSGLSNVGADLHGEGRPTDTLETGPSTPSCGASRGSFGERLGTMGEPQVVANVRDIRAVTTRLAIEQSKNLDKVDKVDGVSYRRRFTPISRKRAILSGPVVSGAALSNDSEPPFSCSTGNDRPCNITTTNHEINGIDCILSKVPPRRVSISTPARTMLNGRLKRHRSSVMEPQELKKLKLDPTVSRVTCSADSNTPPNYQADEPASVRCALSLISEVSAYSNESTDSLFYPSPLSSPASRPGADENYPPTAPSTPLPTSADYVRSKANPLARTIQVYRHRSLNIPPIPPVPIIAPPQDLGPTRISCNEDQAIDRLKALLLRERSERERDGLATFDEDRRERPTRTCASDRAQILRSDSTSTTNSNDDRDQWEEDTTRSATESLGIHESTPSVNNTSAVYRFFSREIWSDAFGITNDFRKVITRWILTEPPKEPVLCEQPPGNKRPLGIDLYDQLTNSPQTRFHAAHLFHKYFLLPDKVAFWKETAKREHLRQEYDELYDKVDWEDGVWDLAVACLALGVKLHRDCLPPLGPIYASEFVEMAPHSMAHNALELAQQDVMYAFQFLLGSCTPQDVLDELWNALPTLRKATAPIRDGWAVVQSVIWDKLFKSFLEPDMLQYPVTLLTAAALIDSLIFALARHYREEATADICKCKALPMPPVSEGVPDDIEPTSSQIYHFEADKLADNVILDVRDVLQLSDMELDECRKWLGYVGKPA